MGGLGERYVSGIAIAVAGSGTASAPSGSVAITDQTNNQAGYGPQTAGYRLNTSGAAQALNNGVATTLETWRLSGVTADYEARATAVSGSVSGGTVGSWIALTTSPEWTVTRTVSGTYKEATITVEIRLSASPFTVLDSAQITISAEVY